MINPSANAAALTMITELENNPGYAKHTAWGVTRGQLAIQLRERLKEEQRSWPNQRNTSLCGPAAFMFCLLNDRPDMYVGHIIDLWAGRRATLGKRSVQPSGQVQATAEATSPKVIDVVTDSTASINAVDWISMASLRNDSPDLNPFGDYDHPTDTLSAITRPHYLKGWFNAAGATTLLDNTSEIFPMGGWDELQELAFYQSSGWVVMLVSAAMFQGVLPGMVTKNHWVVLNGPITVNGRPIQCYSNKAPDLETATIQTRIFTWGNEDEHLTVTRVQPSLSRFLKCFFGGIAFSSIP